jgi:hypothetical protein
MRYTSANARVELWVGSRGDSYDNALAEDAGELIDPPDGTMPEVPPEPRSAPGTKAPRIRAWRSVLKTTALASTHHSISHDLWRGSPCAKLRPQCGIAAGGSGPTRVRNCSTRQLTAGRRRRNAVGSSSSTV